MRITIVTLSLLLTSCVTSPLVHQFDSQRIYPQSKDIVWSALMKFFTENNVQIKTIEKDSGIIYAEREYIGPDHQMALETIADCGKRPMVTAGQASLSLNVFVHEQEGVVSVTINTSISRQWISTGNIFAPSTRFTAPCNSKGAIEEMLLDYIDTHQ